MLAASCQTILAVFNAQEVEGAAKKAAQERGWLVEDGCVAVTDVHTVITARNVAKAMKEKPRMPEFMAKKLAEYQAFMNASSDGGTQQEPDAAQD